MIKPGALMMAAVMAAVAAGTYFGLDRLPPGTIPPPFGRNPPAPTQVAAENPAAVPAPAPAVAATPVPAAAGTPAAPTEQELAEEPAPKPMPATAPASAPAAEVAQAEPAPEAEPAPKAAPALKAEPKSEPATAPKAKPAPKPKAAPAPAEPEPQQLSRTTAESDALKQWWPEPGKLPANQLKLIYAGDVQGEAAIGLLFSEAPNLDSLKLHARVRESGVEVDGTWTAGRNPRLVVFRGLKAGTRYTVILDRELADAKGFALGQTLQGPVYIPVH